MGAFSFTTVIDLKAMYGKMITDGYTYMYYFWSKCEWEVLISPWVGGNDDEEIKVDVAWQIMNNWDVFVDYTWNNRKKL